MKKILLFLILLGSIYSLPILSQNFYSWELDYFRDSYGDVIQSKPFVYNDYVKNSYTHLYIRVFADSYGVPVLVFGIHDNSDNCKNNVSGPTYLSIKNKTTGKEYKSQANKTEGGDIIFFGDKAIEVCKYLNNGNYNLSLNVSRYNARKSYIYSVSKETTGLTTALRKTGRK